ncbi:MAG TPA: hypothetical protein VHN20_05865 [Beijerinckiaceae bacterium]|nr:hypothetical protein [Beijerinckiaceae bacterium]
MATPVDYIRSKAHDFRALTSKITAMQHRAALARIAARNAGNTVMVQDMADTITRLGTLRNLHAAAVAKLDDLNVVLAKLGAPDNYLGVLPAILPVAVVATATAIVAMMVAVYHKSSVESERLALAEKVLGDGRGVPTPQQIEALKALRDVANSGGSNPSGDGVSGVVSSLLRPLAIGVAVVVVGPKVLDMIGRRR